MRKSGASIPGLLLLACVFYQPLVSAQSQAGFEESAGLLDEYREVLQSLERVHSRSEQLQRQIDNRVQASEKAQTNAANRRRSASEIDSLMVRMLDSLKKLVELDLPFQQSERRDRLQQAEAVVDRIDSGSAEKFRYVLAAYQAEINYGREIYFYDDWLELNDVKRSVSFLQLGRIVLAYQTADRSETGFFNPVTRQWEKLPDRYRSVVTEGLRIARKQAAPAMLRLPVAAPVMAE